MPPFSNEDGGGPSKKPALSRQSSVNTSKNGVENPIDPDAPREGRLASLKTRTAAATKPVAPKIAFKPKVVQRRRKDGPNESLLSSSQADDGGQGPSDARIRRAEGARGRGRGRGSSRIEAPLIASGPFAQGPAVSSVGGSGRGQARSSGPPGRMLANTTSSPSSSAAKKSASGAPRTPKDKLETEEEANLDDAGQPMQNLLRMQHDTSDYWAPITTERRERAAKESQIAQPGQGIKTVRVKSESKDMGFIDVKTEPTDSTITSRAPTPAASSSGETRAADVQMTDVPATSESLRATEDDDDDDIILPGFAQEEHTTVLEGKPKVEKSKKKTTVRIMREEEAEEQERLSADLQSLQMNLSPEEPGSGADQLIFIQLPDVLPLWKPGPDDANDDGLVKEEEKLDIVEIDQKAEDNVATKEAPGDTTMEDVQPVVNNLDSSSGEQMPAVDRTSTTSTSVKIEDGDGFATSGQLPGDVLPKKKKKKAKNIAFPPPEGLLGQLHLHRSGKITCDWGGITMDVGTGSDCGFLQEVIAIDEKTDKKAWSLGQVNLRVMLSPNLDDLLAEQT